MAVATEAPIPLLGRMIRGLRGGSHLRAVERRPKVEAVSVQTGEEAPDMEVKSPVEVYMEQTGKPNPFSRRKDLGVYLSSSDGTMHLRDGRTLKLDTSGKVTLVERSKEVILGVSFHDLSPAHLK